MTQAHAGPGGVAARAAGGMMIMIIIMTEPRKCPARVTGRRGTKLEVT